MNPLLTKKELATVLNVTPRTVENYCKRRIIPFVILPGGKRFRPEDVQNFIINRHFAAWGKTFNHHPQGYDR